MTSRLAHHLIQILDETTDTEIPLNFIMQKLGSRPLDAAIFIFSLPNIVLPAISFVFAIPIAFFSIQNILQPTNPKYPAILQRMTINRTMLLATVTSLNWTSRYTTGFIKPRWPAMKSSLSLAVVNIEIFVLALLLFLPVPFGNTPPALAICILSLGAMEEDGFVIAIGVLVGLVCIAICAALLVFGAEIVLFLFGLLSLGH